VVQAADDDDDDDDDDDGDGVTSKALAAGRISVQQKPH